MAATCFGPLGPSSGSIGRNHAKVTVFVEIIKDVLSVSCSILCFNKECICWQKSFEVYVSFEGHINMTVWIKQL
jgi:hypothetical protein